MTLSGDRWSETVQSITACRRCPRLVAHREAVEGTRAAYRGEAYWARPVPGFGDPLARIVLVGLAPAAHGANRTGRMFTGDRSGAFLFASLHRLGLATRPHSVTAHDGVELRDAFVTAAVRCAPPDNRPTPEEIRACAPHLAAELALLAAARVYVCLGGLAWRQVTAMQRAAGRDLRSVAFGHGAEVPADGAWPALLASYHPSQQNTFTGRLTPEMLDQVLGRARELAERRA
jgi:uracil-DNA glycosylase family 4